MNISSHCIFPNRWKPGHLRFDGIGSSSNSSLTHWFPISTIGLRIFVTPSNAETIYGVTRGFPVGVTSSVPLTLNSKLIVNTNVYDYLNPEIPSKPFTYLLF